MIRCICKHCSTAFEVSEHYANAKIACKNCRAIVRIPAAGAAPDSPADVVTPPPAGAPAPAPQAAPKPAAGPAPAPAKAAAIKPTPPSAPGTMPKPAPAAAAPPRPAPAPARAPAPKPTPGSGPGTAPKPAPAPAQAAIKPTPGSGPGTKPKPAPAAAPAAKAPAVAPQQETIAPTLTMVEAVRFGCMLCGGVVLAWPSQIGGFTDCPECKGQTPVPAPLEGSGDVAATFKPAGKSAPGTAPRPTPGAAPKQPAAPVGKGAARPAPGASGKAAGAAPAKGARPAAARQFRFPCPHCNASIAAEPMHAGLMMLCPECKQHVAVPEPAPASS